MMFTSSSLRCIYVICCFVAVVLLSARTVYATVPEVDLPNSSINLSWSVFQKLSTLSPDTVWVPQETPPPVAVTISDMTVSANLLDSLAEISLTMNYLVLAQQGWAEVPLFSLEQNYALSSIILPPGDFLQTTVEGYILVADTKTGTSTRHCTITWTVAVSSNEGISSFSLQLPQAMQCRLTAIAPPTFTDITISNTLFIATVNKGNKTHYKYLLRIPSENCNISYKIPIKNIVADSITTKGLKEEIGEQNKKPVITARQQTVIATSNAGTFTFTALHIAVARAPVTRFTIDHSKDFSLLNVSGNGIHSWKQNEHEPGIEVVLGFSLQSSYTVYLAGELAVDSVFAVPSFTLREAAHQTGIFGLCSDKGSEALVLSASNSNEISLNNFFSELSPGFSDSISRYKYSMDNLILAGRYYVLPFSMTIRMRHHELVPITNALCDAGSIQTVISNDGKIVTQVQLSIRHRERQFVSLQLPDSITIWSATLNNRTISPSVDEKKRHKISLHQHPSQPGAEQPSLLEITYFQADPRTAKKDIFHLRAPLLDLPISKLDWTVFYPEQWSVKKVLGTFTTNTNHLFGKQYLKLGKNEQQSLYSNLKQTNINAISEHSILPESPNHLYAYKILITDEEPWMEIWFGPSATGLLLTVICSALTITTIIIILYRIKKQS